MAAPSPLIEGGQSHCATFAGNYLQTGVVAKSSIYELWKIIEELPIDMPADHRHPGAPTFLVLVVERADKYTLAARESIFAE
jgi:hypothetical protein